MKELYKWGVFGAVAGLATGFLLKTINTVFSWVPGVKVDLQSIQVTGQVSGAVNTGLSTYAQKLFGLIPIGFSVPEMVWSAIGGALFVMLGVFVADKLNLLRGSKVQRVASVMVVAGIASGTLLAGAFSIPTLSAIVNMVVDALVLGFLWVAVDNWSGAHLIPG